MSEPSACPDCLRRARLLAHLAPVHREAGDRRAGLALAGTAAPLRRGPRRGRRAEGRRAGAERGSPRCRRRSCGPSWRRRGAGAAAATTTSTRSPCGDAADAPWALIGRGDPELLRGLAPADAVTVVGARRASTYGREVARELGRELAAAGLVVVSGLAFGIDACAHRGALEGGLTFAVLGCGADVAYPAAHRSLWRRIGERGLVLSELPPGTGAWRWTFPARNRIMAALGAMTVVVEAAERSGSLITADLAADLGRDLGAVPGPVGSRLSAGPNNLLAGGACVVRGAQDVLDAMLGAGVRTVERTGPPLGTREQRGAGGAGAGRRDQRRDRRRPRPRRRRDAAALADLEAGGYVACSLLGVYSRTTLKPSSDI